MILHLYLVRHGQTYFNRYNRLQGWSNSPLTHEGLDDALRAGEKLKNVDFAAAFCSDTTRAEVTAHAILRAHAEAKEQNTDPPELVTNKGFREQFYGYFEGQDMGMSWYAAGAPHGVKTYNDIVSRFGLAATKDFLKEADPFHDAESEEEYWARIKGGFALIARAAHTANAAARAASPTSSQPQHHLQEGSNVLLISHGNTLLSLMHKFGGPELDLSERPANGSVTVKLIRLVIVA